jgi:hypothetical protein
MNFVLVVYLYAVDVKIVGHPQIPVQVPRIGMNLVDMLTYMTIIIIITTAFVHVIAWVDA